MKFIERLWRFVLRPFLRTRARKTGSPTERLARLYEELELESNALVATIIERNNAEIA
jgi:hypothetical protein